jgi:hypothetical protein
MFRELPNQGIVLAGTHAKELAHVAAMEAIVIKSWNARAWIKYCVTIGHSSIYLSFKATMKLVGLIYLVIAFLFYDAFEK